MELLDRFLGFTRRKQEKLLAELEIQGEPRKEFFPPKSKEASIVKVDNDQFLKLLKSEKYDQVVSNLVHQSDTHQSYDLYIDIGEGVLIKTGVYSPDYGDKRNLFSDLHEMSFKDDPKESKPGWGVYRIERF